jgi:hypothetical protein
MGWIKKFFTNCIIVFISVLAALIFAEILLHLTRVQYKYLYPLEPGGYLKHDAELGFDIQPNFATSTHNFFDYAYPVWSNSLGCFDYEYDGNSSFVYLTGDSFAWGFTPLEEKWGKKIEIQTGVRTLTCGVNAFGPRQEVIKARNTLAKLSRSPELIIMSYLGENDPYDDFIFPNFTAYKGYRVPAWTHCDAETMLTTSPLVPTTTCNVAVPQYSFLQNIKFELAAHSVLYMIATRQFGLQNILREWLGSFSPEWGKNVGLLHESQPTYEEGANDRTWESHIKNFESMRDLAKKYNSKLLVVIIPSKEMTRAQKIDPNWPSEKLKLRLEALGIPYVDLTPEFREQEKLPEKSFFWDFDGHWNIAGNRLAGELVSKYILEHQLMGTTTP